MYIGRNSYRMITDNLYEGMYFVDRNRIIRYWNKTAEKISGYTADEVIGKSCSDNILTHVDEEGHNLCLGMCPLADTITDGKTREAKVFLHHKDGYRMPVSIRVGTLTNSKGEVIGGVELFTSAGVFQTTDLKVKKLEEMAFFDKLTGLANRSYLEKELLIRFEEQKRFATPFGILFMDIDHFKRFNDTYGHDAGDRVLKYVADTFLKNARPFDLFGRWGGEEFIGILRNLNEQQLKHLGDRLRILLENSYIVLEKEKLYVSISIGATITRNNDDIDTLLKRADTLLYESKKAGRNRLTLG